MRSSRAGNGKPCASCSAWFQPAPSPSSTRPPEMWSTVATIRESTDGRRKVAGETIVPSLIRSVTAASPASVAQASSEPRPDTSKTDW